MKTVEWAWNSDPDTPDEKLVLIAMARDTYRTPLELWPSWVPACCGMPCAI